MKSIKKDEQEEIYDINRFDWINNELAIYETEHEGNRCIVTWSEKRADRDRNARMSLLEKIAKKLSKNNVKAVSFVSNRRCIWRTEGKFKGPSGFSLDGS